MPLVDVYDPLSYKNLARSVVDALLANQVGMLPPASPVVGCGVYAIYYAGKLKFYSHISSAECNTPIYVGKAVPLGARRGSAEGEPSTGMELYRRLVEHSKSIEPVENLALPEFRCRYLVVVPVWITLAERFLIDHFRPIWNTIVDGFGNHPPGEGRRNMRRPRWDIVHPGRSWAEQLKATETPEQVVSYIEAARK